MPFSWLPQAKALQKPLFSGPHMLVFRTTLACVQDHSSLFSRPQPLVFKTTPARVQLPAPVSAGLTFRKKCYPSPHHVQGVGSCTEQDGPLSAAGCRRVLGITVGLP